MTHRYKNMFDNINKPAPSRASMFGEKSVVERGNMFGVAKGDNSAISEWLSKNPSIKISASKINFILGGVDPIDMTPMQIEKVGEFHVNESSETNKSIENVVGMFDELKAKVTNIKSEVIAAIDLIQSGATSQAKKSLLGWFKAPEPTTPDWEGIRYSVEMKITKIETHLGGVYFTETMDDFISGLDDAIDQTSVVTSDIDNSISAIEYLLSTQASDKVKELAERRKIMFAKMVMILRMGIQQLEDMKRMCIQNKNFYEEYLNVIKPLISVILRASSIKSDDVKSLSDIQNQIKSIL